MKELLNRVFKLDGMHTSIRTEFVAGLTTFLTMAYIIALNPNILTGWQTGSALWNGVFLATCIASAIGMFICAFWANKPFGMAPGMGLNSFLAIVVAHIVTITGVDYTQGYQAAMCIVLIEGIVFLLVSLFDKEHKIIKAIPQPVRHGIAPAIGIMLMNIGFGSNVGVYDETGNAWYVMRDFFGSLTAAHAKESMGTAWGPMVLTVVTILIGVLVIAVLAHFKIKSAVLLGMLAASVIYWAGEAIFFGMNPFASLAGANWLPPFKDMAATTLFKFNFATLFSLGITSVLMLVFTFCFIDYADSVGTMIGTATKAGLTDEEGIMPQMRESLASDAIATIAGSATGTSTVTTFIESASGIEAGGRTGLTAIFTGLMFLACIFIAPIAALIPAAATSAALIYVGVLMLSELKNVDWTDISYSVPVAIMLLAMPISSSIGHGIGLALISYTLIRIFTKRAKDVSILTYILSVLFLIKFFLPIG